MSGKKPGSRAPVPFSAGWKPPLTVLLKRGKSKPFWLGHPWIFSGAIEKVDGEVGDIGNECIVLDERKNPVGTGYYNPHGKIAVRLIEHRRTTDVEFEPLRPSELVRRRIPKALARRAALGLPSDSTNAYRLVNAEGDLLTGLVVDRLGSALSLQLNSRMIYQQRDAIRRQLFELTAGDGVDRIRVSVSETASKLEAVPVMNEVYERGSKTPTISMGPVEIQENGIRYSVDLEAGQKTGFYVDQRENRRRFAALCRGQEVLDLYSYVGGFGISAAKAGAKEVTSVDSSKPAITQLVANAELNGVSDKVTGVVADGVTFLKESHAVGRRWTRIVCDPPKLARGRSHLKDALKKYIRINTLAMSALEEDGLLLSCSCSQHVSDEAFLRVLTEAAHRLRRSVVVHAVWSQPGDHPALSVAPESRYLKAYLVSLAD
ncbi:MAG: 23S rRNA (cytosine1962-C5)-methyltransferase [Myxococcota bacterium]|jgi:23S rRNA (cytosine1962-C5)-methyltransferase